MKKLLLYISIFILPACSKDKNEPSQTGTLIRAEANWTGHVVNTGTFANASFISISTFPGPDMWREIPVGNSLIKEFRTDEAEISCLGHLLIEGFNQTGTYSLYANNALVLQGNMGAINDASNNLTILEFHYLWQNH